VARPADAAVVLPVECELAARWGTVVAPDIGTQNLAVVPTITGTLLATAFPHTRGIGRQQQKQDKAHLACDVGCSSSYLPT
jgi:hypothetical protein